MSIHHLMGQGIPPLPLPLTQSGSSFVWPSRLSYCGGIPAELYLVRQAEEMYSYAGTVWDSMGIRGCWLTGPTTESMGQPG